MYSIYFKIKAHVENIYFALCIGANKRLYYRICFCSFAALLLFWMCFYIFLEVLIFLEGLRWWPQWSLQAGTLKTVVCCCVGSPVHCSYCAGGTVPLGSTVDSYCFLLASISGTLKLEPSILTIITVGTTNTFSCELLLFLSAASGISVLWLSVSVYTIVFAVLRRIKHFLFLGHLLTRYRHWEINNYYDPFPKRISLIEHAQQIWPV